MSPKKRSPRKPCACGCGQLIAPLRTWAHGHQPVGPSGKPISHAQSGIPKLCHCGCKRAVPVPPKGRTGMWHPECGWAKAEHERERLRKKNLHRNRPRPEKGAPSRGQTVNGNSRGQDPDRISKRVCDECSDLPHRRPIRGCPRCRLPFAAEATRDILECSTGFSSILMMQRWL